MDCCRASWAARSHSTLVGEDPEDHQDGSENFVDTMIQSSVGSLSEVLLVVSSPAQTLGANSTDNGAFFSCCCMVGTIGPFIYVSMSADTRGYLD
jgi:hypothetical protein